MSNQNNDAQIAAYAAALSVVLNEMDFDEMPSIIPSLQLLNDTLTRKLSSYPRPGPIIDLRPRKEGPSV